MAHARDDRDAYWRKVGLPGASSVQDRHDDDGDGADAFADATAPVVRLVAMWKRSIARSGSDLVRFGCWLALLDFATGLSGCFAPLLTTLLEVARIVGLAILVPAVLRVLALRHADRSDADLLKAVAIGIGAAVLYVVVRTAVVVEICSLL